MGKNDFDKEDAEWTQIDQALIDMFVPPKGLEERIRQSVRQKAPAWERKPVAILARRIPWLQYAAAAIVMIALLSTVILHSISRRESVDALASASGKVSSNEGAIKAVEKDYRLDRHLPELAESEKEAGRRMPLRMAGVASNNRQASGNSQFHVGIAPVVQHVWIVSDLEKAEALLRHICDVNGKKAAVSMKNSEGMVYSFSLTDVELQNLVNILHGEQWHLVSPDYPQPSEEYNVDFVGKNVDYGIRIVKQ